MNLLNKYLELDSNKNYLKLYSKILNNYFDNFLIKNFENNFTNNFYSNCDNMNSNLKIIYFKNLNLEFESKPFIFINILAYNLRKLDSTIIEQNIDFKVYEDKFIIKNITPFPENNKPIEFCYLIIKNLDYSQRN